LKQAQIVAVTSQRDIAADLVVLECERRGVDLHRFNSEQFPTVVGINADPVRGLVELLDGDEVAVSLSSARSIWIRRPQWPAQDPSIVDQADQRLRFSESVATLAGAWRLLKDRCVSPADSLQAARWKLPQLRVAAALGFEVPDTLVTTSPSRAKRFLQDGPAVIKAVAEARVATPEGERIGSVQTITADDRLDEVELAPTMFQRLVEKVADVRVTMVGQLVFAVAIRVPPGAPLDFRDTDPNACTYDIFDLRRDDIRRCVGFMERYGLRFGAFDFGLRQDGSLVFFECNPNGQWGWIEAHSGLAITAAVVDLLVDPSRLTHD
jgi:hypothetical protein